MNAGVYYITKLEDELQRRQRANPSYSLRAFAKFLNIDSSTLAAVLKKKRPFPLARAKSVATKLGLSPEERDQFLASIFVTRANLAGLAKADVLRTSTKVLDEETHFRVIAEWEHYAVLSLMDTKDFRSDVAWIAKRLGVSELRAKTVLQRLIDSGLMKIDERGDYQKDFGRMNTTEDIVSASLRKSHKEALEMGIEKLESIDIRQRDYSSETFAIDPERMPEAKALIREFREKMSALMRDGNQSEVYQLCVQLYPLTQLQKEMSR